ncbi:PorV/PorQ family protein [Tenacibaculum sp. M341]|uniref:putative type IX sorting system protein PorV2 n=1 Tax=Tenacibaculum sp. M341 TaxID=2530339 RepID=UPI001FB54C73|nr:PorV/PorQ family protein [Tenacibaculum sp. M341]
MKTKFIYFFLLLSVIAHGQFRNYSNEFLNIGVDAAALGMSKAVVASSNDVNSSYWNPAGLVNVEDYQGSLMHASYFSGIATYNFAGFAMPIDNESAVGLSLIRFGVDDILNTTELIDSQGNIDFNRISLFSAADYAFNVSYAKKMLLDGFSIGGNAKIIRRIIGDFATSWGFGFDLGVQFERNGWKFGAMARDITTTFNTWAINEDEFAKISNAIPGQNQELPETTEITKPKLQVGVAKEFKIGRDFNLLTELDLNMRFAETNDIISTSFVSVDPAFGFQLDYDNIVYLRLGAGNFQNVTEFDNSTSLSVQPNFGLGFVYKGIHVDYALTNIGSVGNALFSNIFSIKFDYSFYR